MGAARDRAEHGVGHGPAGQLAGDAIPQQVVQVALLPAQGACRRRAARHHGEVGRGQSGSRPAQDEQHGLFDKADLGRR